jgi:DNA-binding FadR family transcriptional regulator
LRKLLFNNTSIASRNLETGELKLPQIQNIFLAAVGIGHETGSHSSTFHEALAQLLDLVSIPIHLMHALVLALLSRLDPSALIPTDVVLHSKIAQAVGSDLVAHLLSGIADVRNGKLQMQALAVPSGILMRVKQLAGFNRNDNDLLLHAYAQLAASA